MQWCCPRARDAASATAAAGPGRGARTKAGPEGGHGGGPQQHLAGAECRRRVGAVLEASGWLVHFCVSVLRFLAHANVHMCTCTSSCSCAWMHAVAENDRCAELSLIRSIVRASGLSVFKQLSGTGPELGQSVAVRSLQGARM
eukprot:scaffold288823_cov19-Tisochrysis_lutea.AAC.2